MDKQNCNNYIKYEVSVLNVKWQLSFNYSEQVQMNTQDICLYYSLLTIQVWEGGNNWRNFPG